MKNSIIIFGSVAVILVLGIAGFYALSQKPQQPDSMMPDENQASTQKEDSMEKDEAMMASSRYVEYSKTALDESADGRRVLFFYANWCPTCRPADANFQQNESKIPQDLTLIRVNYNDPDTDGEEEELARKYEVVYQHTFVQIDSEGNIVGRWNGGQIEELLSNIKQQAL